MGRARAWEGSGGGWTQDEEGHGGEWHGRGYSLEGEGHVRGRVKGFVLEPGVLSSAQHLARCAQIRGSTPTCQEISN